MRRRTLLELVGRLDFWKSLGIRNHPAVMEYDFNPFLRGTGHVLLYGYCLVYGLKWVVGWLVFGNPSVYKDFVP